MSTWQAIRANQAGREQSRLRVKETQMRQDAEARAYASDMNLVQGKWEAGNLQRAQALLRAHSPKPGERDLRGFEWRYLWKLCRDESRGSFNCSNVVSSVSFSLDGRLLAASSGEVVKLFDTATWREVAALPDADEASERIAFSPAATNILATAGGAGARFGFGTSRRDRCGRSLRRACRIRASYFPPMGSRSGWLRTRYWNSGTWNSGPDGGRIGRNIWWRHPCSHPTARRSSRGAASMEILSPGTSRRATNFPHFRQRTEVGSKARCSPGMGGRSRRPVTMA